MSLLFFWTFVRLFRRSPVTVFVTLIAIGLCLPATALARETSRDSAIRWWQWTPSPTHARFLIPSASHASGQEALESYRHAIQQNRDLKNLLGDALEKLPTGKIESYRWNRRFKVMLLSNSPRDYLTQPGAINRFRPPFERAGAEVLVLPLAAGLNLSHPQQSEMKSQVSNRIDLLVAMGGADVTPDLYRRAQTFARDFNPTRDLHEIELIRHYNNQGHGFLLGVCRGAQLSAVSEGYCLIQDIAKETQESIAHEDGEHEAILQGTTHSILKNLLGAEAKNGRIWINSLHHEAIESRNEGSLEVAAVSPGGIVEAMEFRNGKGLLLQYHPERMPDSGEKMLENLVRKLKAARGAACENNWLLKQKF